MTQDERDLIRRSRDGDQRAFEALVVLKRDKAVRVALHIVGNEDDAKDIAQSAFIKLWSALDQFDDASPFDPWFYKIVVNLAIDFHRREARAPRAAALSSDPAPAVDVLFEPAGPGSAEPVEPPAAPTADAGVMRAELRRVFSSIAADLPPAQRAVFTLREIEGMETAEIAGILGIKASTVRNHLLQARRALQDALRKRYPEYFRKGRG